MGADTWLWFFALGLLLVTSLIVVGTVLLTKKNLDTANNQILFPFSGILKEKGSLSLKDGSPQIKCPVGKKVRILGAYFQVYDPYLECSGKEGATKQFQRMCSKGGYTSKCDDSACSHVDGSVSTACICANTDPAVGYRNCTCYQGGKARCKVRDASAFLADYCDGRNSCPIDLDTGDGSVGGMSGIVNALGALPCNLVPKDKEYEGLPYIPGNQGVEPGKGQWNRNAKPVPATVNHGYAISGVYSCE